MRWITVESTNIKKIGYNKSKQELFVEFNSGNQYKYMKVQQDIYSSFKDAESKGKFFQQTIKGCFDYERI